jgi:transcription termination/antitermination protein NusA
MSKEILHVVEAMANEKNVSRSVVFEALESALATAAKKASNVEIATRVSINRTNGSYETYGKSRSGIALDGRSGHQTRC